MLDSNQQVLESSQNEYDVMPVRGNCVSLNALLQEGERVKIVELAVNAGSKLCNFPLNDLFNIVRRKVLVCTVNRN